MFGGMAQPSERAARKSCAAAGCSFRAGGTSEPVHLDELWCPPMTLSRETVAAFGRELASFTLQGPAANSNACRVAIKEASTAVADLSRYFAADRRHKAIANLVRDLSCFSLAPVATPLFEIRKSP